MSSNITLTFKYKAMTLSDYSQLKQRVVVSVIIKDSHNNLLQNLKEFFRNGINSVRRYEQIKSIEQLLKVLELRDLLSEDNITPLKHIADTIESEELLNKIHEYEKSHVPREYVNYYATENKNKSFSTECFMRRRTPLEGGMQDKKKEKIYLKVTEQIGSAWRDLARNLKFHESVIDEIDANNKTMASKASKMLKRFDLFYSSADRLKWYYVLCKALDRIGRKELRYTVQEMMSSSLTRTLDPDMRRFASGL